MFDEGPLKLAVAAALIRGQARLFGAIGEDPMSHQAVVGEVASDLMAGVHGAQAAIVAQDADPVEFLRLAKAMTYAPLQEDIDAMRDLLVRYGWTQPGTPEADPYVAAVRSGLSEVF
jgi:hypothetical protein